MNVKLTENKMLENQYAEIQQNRIDKIELYDKISPEEIQLISGVDLAYWRDKDVDYAVCCVVTINYATKDVIEMHSMIDSIDAAYISGYLHYRNQKEPKQVSPGTRQLEGQYVDDLGRVQPWKAHYDEYGRLTGRTDYNAGNATQGIQDSHYHTYELGSEKIPLETGSHIEGEYKP